MGASAAETARGIVHRRSWLRRFAQQYTSLLRKNRAPRRAWSSQAQSHAVFDACETPPPFPCWYSHRIPPVGDQSYEPAHARPHEAPGML